MKDLSMLVASSFANAIVLGLAATTCGFLKPAPAAAASLSFVGSFADPNQTFSTTFVTTASSLVNFRSYGYDGGTNAAEITISAGGFDPILTVFDNPTGNFIFEQNATATGTDFNVDRTLEAGDYRVVISAFANFLNQQPNPSVPRNIADRFENQGDFFGRQPNYAFDINIANLASTTAVPEPSDFVGTVVAGFIVVMFRRKLSFGKKQK